MNDDEDKHLEQLDARAEALGSQFDSESEFDPDTASSTSSGHESKQQTRTRNKGNVGEYNDEYEDDEVDNDPELAREAAVMPVATNVKRRRNITTDINHEEDDKVLNAVGWQDMEDQRRFLTEEHQEQLYRLIQRWEHENADEGDDVDLNTGLIVHSTGHLQALLPKSDLALIGNSLRSEDDSEDDEEEEDDDDDEANGHDDNNINDQTIGYDPGFAVCQKPAKLLDAIVESIRQRWIL